MRTCARFSTSFSIISFFFYYSLFSITIYDLINSGTSSWTEQVKYWMKMTKEKLCSHRRRWKEVESMTLASHNTVWWHFYLCLNIQANLSLKLGFLRKLHGPPIAAGSVVSGLGYSSIKNVIFFNYFLLLCWFHYLHARSRNSRSSPFVNTKDNVDSGGYGEKCQRTKGERSHSHCHNVTRHALRRYNGGRRCVYIVPVFGHDAE